MNTFTIGFIGQGFVGKSYADDFETRGYETIRYSLEAEYLGNKDKIRDCDIVFVAVPTPTTPEGFDFSIVEDALTLIGDGKIAVIKSTILPGTTNTLQEKFKNISVLHSPEFLREKYAKEDVANPERNIIGVPELNQIYKEKANVVLSVLSPAPFSKIMLAKEAELVKYIGNCFLYEKIVFFNQMNDLAVSIGANYENVREAVIHDKRIGDSHTHILHTSNDAEGLPKRGAGGHCFIKDFEALLGLYKELLPNDSFGIESLQAVRNKNNHLLVSTKKDLHLLEKVVGDISMYK